jgi:hypothetical protein
MERLESYYRERIKEAEMKARGGRDERITKGKATL